MEVWQKCESEFRKSRDISDAGLHALAHQNAEGSSYSTNTLSRVAEGNRFVFPY